MQHLAKFLKNSVHGVQSHLKFSKIAYCPRQLASKKQTDNKTGKYLKKKCDKL